MNMDEQDAHEQDLAQPEGSIDRARALAQDIGREHGTAAGSWIVEDGLQARAVLKYSEEGTFFDYYDSGPGPLSGEWADGYSVDQLVRDCGMDPNMDETDRLVTIQDELAEAYLDSYWSALEDEAVRSARAMLPDDSAYQALDQDVAYTVEGWTGIAVRLDGPGDSDGMAYVVMIGDDRRRQVPLDDLTALDEGEWCPGCGQTGHNFGLLDH
jgi:hypothetical protein